VTYIDVDASLRSNRYEGHDLLRLAEEHDPGFDSTTFADALLAVRRLPAAEFYAYGLSEDETSALVDRLIEWATSIRSRHSKTEDETHTCRCAHPATPAAKLAGE
jgi:hypothetical protein